MSVPIGFSPIELAVLIRETYHGLRNAPGEFRSLRLQTDTLKQLLNQLVERMRRFALSQEQQHIFTLNLNACRETAEKMRAAFTKYRRLRDGPWYKNVDKRALWAMGSTRKFDVQLRDHIMTLGIMCSILGDELHRAHLDKALNILRSELRLVQKQQQQHQQEQLHLHAQNSQLLQSWQQPLMVHQQPPMLPAVPQPPNSPPHSPEMYLPTQSQPLRVPHPASSPPSSPQSSYARPVHPLPPLQTPPPHSRQVLSPPLSPPQSPHAQQVPFSMPPMMQQPSFDQKKFQSLLPPVKESVFRTLHDYLPSEVMSTINDAFDQRYSLPGPMPAMIDELGFAIEDLGHLTAKASNYLR